MKKEKQPRTAIAYVRKNLMKSDGDASDIAKQFQAIYEFADKNGYKLINSYCDYPVSGLDAGPEFRRMNSDIKSGSVKPNAIISLDYHRFGRRKKILKKLLKAIKSKNIAVISLAHPRDKNSLEQFVSLLFK